MTARRRRTAGAWPRPTRRNRKIKLGKLTSGVVFNVGKVLLLLAAVVLLTVGLVTQSVLFFLTSALSGLGGLAMARAQQLHRRRDAEKKAAKSAAAAAKMKPKREESTTEPPRREGRRPAGAPRQRSPQQPGGQVLCTETGRNVDDCDCATRHVATTDGAHRYGLPVGSPMGKRKKKPKPAGTSRAKSSGRAR